MVISKDELMERIKRLEREQAQAKKEFGRIRARFQELRSKLQLILDNLPMTLLWIADELKQVDEEGDDG